MYFLNGYKTYLTAATLAIVGIVEGVLGIDVPGVELSDNWFATLLVAAGFGATRHAIAKQEQK